MIITSWVTPLQILKLCWTRLVIDQQHHMCIIEVTHLHEGMEIKDVLVGAHLEFKLQPFAHASRA